MQNCKVGDDLERGEEPPNLYARVSDSSEYNAVCQEKKEDNDIGYRAREMRNLQCKYINTRLIVVSAIIKKCDKPEQSWLKSTIFH